MTFYISPTGNDSANGSLATPWKSLFKATSTVTTPGDIIHVLAGTYTETQTCSLSVGVSIEGDSASTTILKSSKTGDWNSFIQLESPDGTNGAQSISNITIDGQYVSETNFKTWIGIWVTGRSNVSIHDCVIKNFKQSGAILTGIHENNPGTDQGKVHAIGNKFYNNTVTNSAAMYQGTGQGAIMIGFQNGLLIYNNHIQASERPNFKNGWPIKYHNQGWLKGCKIYNNTLIKRPYAGTYPGENSDWDFAIEFFNIEGLEIYGNDIQNGAIDLNYNYKHSYPYSVWIHDNVIHNPVFNSKVEGGIILEFRTEGAIIENNIINNKAYGVTFNTRGVSNKGGDRDNYVGGNTPGGYSYLVDNVIRNNLFTNIYEGQGVGNSFAIGVISEGTDDPQINNMQIYNNTIVGKSGNGMRIGLDFTSQPLGNCQNLLVRNNIVYGSKFGWLQGSNTRTSINGCVVTYNDAFANGSNVPDWPAGNPTNYTYSNNLAVNPMFVSSTDYHLQPGSPLIKAGYNGADIGYYTSTTTPANIPPVANAGTDQTVTLPNNNVTLSGSGTDSDGTIVSYAWVKVSGPSGEQIGSATSAVTSVSNLVQGTYVFRLTVTDNLGATGTDTVLVTVNGSLNNGPIVNAGADQAITLPTSTISISGNATDSDGTIASYSWTKVSGPAGSVIVSPSNASTTINNLAQGVHVFRLTATDNLGVSGFDEMTVIVNSQVNVPPIVNTGADQIVTLPINSVTLSGSGSDSDGTIVSNVWSKVSGPTATIVSPNSYVTLVNNLSQGIYVFQLRVVDNNGAVSIDTVQITVNASTVNTPPVVTVSTNQTLTISLTVTLVGSATDSNGTIASYTWTKVSGPAGSVIVSPTSATTDVTGLVKGTYVFRLTATDNLGASGFKNTTVTIK